MPSISSLWHFFWQTSSVHDRPRKQTMSERLDVIAVGAHPDDVEVACGGTLAALAAAGRRIGIVDLTDGEPTPYSTGTAQRMEEADQAASELGVQRRIQLGLPNRELMDSVEARIKLATIFRRYRPQLVISFGDKTPLASPDHYQAMLICDAAVFYSRLSKWQDRFDDLQPHMIDRHLYFRLALEPITLQGNNFHTVVDITETLETKIRSVFCYHSQFDHKHGIEDRIRAAAVMTGTLAGVKAAECFAAAKPYATEDLWQSLSLPK